MGEISSIFVKWNPLLESDKGDDKLGFNVPLFSYEVGGGYKTIKQQERGSVTTSLWVCNPGILSEELISTGWPEEDSVSCDFLNFCKEGEEDRAEARETQYQAAARRIYMANSAGAHTGTFGGWGEGNSKYFMGECESIRRTMGFLDQQMS